MINRALMFMILFIWIDVVLFPVAGQEKQAGGAKVKRGFNQPYQGDFLNRIAFPIGGIGAGMICLEGTGAISHVSVRNGPDVFNEPLMFAAISVGGFKNR